MKVLISAYACEPDKGSEPGVGWNWVKQIAKFAEVWIITRANNKSIIESELEKNPVPNLHFSYYDVPKWLGFWKKKTRGLYFYYFLWQLGAYRLAKSLRRQRQYDIVHHLTFGNLWLPTFMPFLQVPFIWGPIGGGEQVPKAFRKEYDLKSKVKEMIRDTIVSILKINLLFLYTCKTANIIIAKTRDTANKIPVPNRTKVIITTDVATNSKNIEVSNRESKNLQIIAIGRLDAWRGFDLILKAFSRIKDDKKIRLLILGEGSDKRRLQGICKSEDLENSVIFTGHVENEKYLDYLSHSSIFVNPNLKEGGVTVLFDALAYELPVVCLDIAGASEIVIDDCGIKIKPMQPEQTIKDLAAALLKLTNDPELRKRMGEAGKRRVLEHYTWEKKGEFIQELYQSLLKK